MLGTHGRSGMKAFWKGSVAAKIVSLSSAPILLVPLHE
ncbi:MAG: universal stress protein [Spirochaetota bacterium]